MDGFSSVVAESELFKRASVSTPKRRFRLKLPDRWGAFALLLAALICLPIGAVLLQVGQESESWDHLVKTVLGGYLANTLILVAGVTLIASLMAVPSAWLVTCFDFPGRKFLNWGLVLPLAIPTYVAAFVFYEGPQAAIPFLVWVRTNWGIDAFLSFVRLAVVATEIKLFFEEVVCG